MRDISVKPNVRKSDGDSDSNSGSISDKNTRTPSLAAELPPSLSTDSSKAEKKKIIDEREAAKNITQKRTIEMSNASDRNNHRLNLSGKVTNMVNENNAKDLAAEAKENRKKESQFLKKV